MAAFHAASVLVTDLPSNLSLLESNTSNAMQQYPTMNLQASILDWYSYIFPSKSYSARFKPNLLDSHFDIILCSDCVYDAHLFAPFLNTLQSLCDSSTTIIASIKLRNQR